MKTVIFSLLAHSLVAGPAMAAPEPDVPHDYSVQDTGFDKAELYRGVRGKAFDTCDASGGYVSAIKFNYLAGWGAANGRHIVQAEVTCKGETP